MDSHRGPKRFVVGVVGWQGIPAIVAVKPLMIHEEVIEPFRTQCCLIVASLRVGLVEFAVAGASTCARTKDGVVYLRETIQVLGRNPANIASVRGRYMNPFACNHILASNHTVKAICEPSGE